MLLKKKFTTGLKNNLQVIALLLDLQADKFKSKIGVTSSEIIDVSGKVRIEYYLWLLFMKNYTKVKSSKIWI